MTYWLDMDGTFVDLYGVEDWLPMLIAHDPTPYTVAKPLVRLSTLARYLNTLQRNGNEIGIISWLADESDILYDTAVTEAKLNWLTTHMPSVHWDYINIVPHGTPKHKVCKNGCLFDDDKKNRKAWDCGEAYDVDNILGILHDLVRG